MGSLESGIPSVTRDPSLRSPSISLAIRRRLRSKFSHFRLDYLQWLCSVAVFLSFVISFTLFLPGLKDANINPRYLFSLRDKIAGLYFAEHTLRFEPSNVLLRFQREAVDLKHLSAFNVTLRRFSHRKPQLALVFADLLPDQQQLLMVSVGAALCEIGYDIQVYSLEDGPARDAWKKMGVTVSIVQSNYTTPIGIDWLNFNGIFVNSLEAKSILYCFMQEPFKYLPLFLIVDNTALAIRAKEYNSTGQTELLNIWKKIFNRATAVIFPNYALPISFSAFDSGNFLAVSGSPAAALDADSVLSLSGRQSYEEISLGSGDFVIGIVCSQFFYKGLWLEHALLLKAIKPLLADLGEVSASHVRILIFCGTSSSKYSVALEAIAQKLGYPIGTVEHKAVDDDANRFLRLADLVIYGSFLEEKTFPEILIKAMCFGKPVMAPNLSMISKYVDDRMNGFLFPKGNLKALREIIKQLVWKGKLSALAHEVALRAKVTARNFGASEAVEGYAQILETILRLPSEVSTPKSVGDLSPEFKKHWKWDFFGAVVTPVYQNRTLRSLSFLGNDEELWNQTLRGSLGKTGAEELFVYSIWEEQKSIELTAARKKREDEELKDRTEQSHGTWEDVYRSAKKADRTKNDLRERDERELERTGQPLCIYEPFLGEGTWPFLHVNSLYRGIGLSTKGRRPGGDDIDGPSRLPILNNPYYRDILGDFGAYFSISNRIDRIHKNAWIGFQSWRATANKACLSAVAETALISSIQSKKHGDALYFWIRMDKDHRNPLQQDFWSFCDSINAGNCKFAFLEALKRMYGFNFDLSDLPPMPSDGDTWSVMQSWALPTKSFLEFTMFSRMFVDALDEQMYEEHHQTGHCYMSLSQDKHCYSRVLELLVNVWAYHSARRMFYVDPLTGLMQEQHRLHNRKGRMWIKWFSYVTLKSMDEDYAEEFDSDHPRRRWLWPSTGEIFWQGVLERERSQRHKQKERRKQLSKEKIERIKRRQHQKALGKYIKPPLEELDNSNTTTVQ
ncbi:hypothetical protein SAY86_024046 [Trapa natans]|uniref:Glycosyl transferase family 1 domain-containing protein n=1 Tax=Trapa natans TaxID=22666 RepID=A0AAN7MBG3_TRANT|nr:hypothetical protein SAY86_024046 [Trapa natans]